MKRESHKSGRHEQAKEGKVFGKGTYPLSEELKARIEAQRALEQKGKGKPARPVSASEPPAPKEPSLLPLVTATVVMVLLAIVMVLRVFVF